MIETRRNAASVKEQCGMNDAPSCGGEGGKSGGEEKNAEEKEKNERRTSGFSSGFH